tara:strand:+ start:266 stop:463 length:198 start_codon:yes stop_codon:yes gene_type:complete
MDTPIASTMEELETSIKEIRERLALSNNQVRHWTGMLKQINQEMYGIIQKTDIAIDKTKGENQCK